MAMEYIYLGDRLTEDQLKGKRCRAVRRQDGKCIRSQTMGTMLVQFEEGPICTVIGRRLRKLRP